MNEETKLPTTRDAATEQDKGRCAPATGSADAPDFRSELCALINKHSMENGSNTPDFILNQFLADVLMCFNKAVRRRAQWYGHETAPCDNPPNDPTQPRRADDVNRESGTECAIRRWLQWSG